MKRTINSTVKTAVLRLYDEQHSFKTIATILSITSSQAIGVVHDVRCKGKAIH